MQKFKVLDAYTAKSEKTGVEYKVFSYETVDKNGHKRYGTEFWPNSQDLPKVGDNVRPTYFHDRETGRWLTTGWQKA